MATAVLMFIALLAQVAKPVDFPTRNHEWWWMRHRTDDDDRDLSAARWRTTLVRAKITKGEVLLRRFDDQREYNLKSAKDMQARFLAAEAPPQGDDVWFPMEGDVIAEMIGNRKRYIGEHSFYVAVSSQELRLLFGPDRDLVYGDRRVWPFMAAQRDGFLIAVMHENDERAFMALRADLFKKHQTAIEAVHHGELPKEVLRFESIKDDSTARR